MPSVEETMRPSPQPLEVSHIEMTSRVPLLPTDISVGALWDVIPVGRIIDQEKPSSDVR